MAEAALAVQHNSMESILRQGGVLVAIAASVALGVYVVLWAQQPNYALLYGDLADRDLTQVIEALDAADIAYQLNHASGAILVPGSEVDTARLKLAAAGLPRGNAVGFEMMEEKAGIGTSQFMEQARYHRAMEGELSRTIARIRNVRAATVHLAIPRETLFARRQKIPSASVFVDLFPGRGLDDEQVAAITHLVSSGIPNLPPDRVTIVDQQGKLLTDQSGDSRMVMATKRIEITRRYEQSLVDNIVDILSPMAGADGVRAEVAADLDFTTVQQVSHDYDADLPAPLSTRTVEEERRGGASGGPPGALSNEPPALASAPETTAVEGTDGTAPEPAPPLSRRTEKLVNNELSETITNTRPAEGDVRRLSVAVVIRNPAAAGGDEEPAGFSDQQLATMTALVKGAIGFDPARGDTLNIEPVDFLVPPPPEPLPDLAIWQQPWVWNVARQVAGGLFVLFLVFGVLRPTINKLMTPPARPGNALATIGPDGLPALPPGEGGAQGAGGADVPRLAPPEGMENQLTELRQAVNQDPRLAAQVVRGWVGDDK